jgi:hypothetical protein
MYSRTGPREQGKRYSKGSKKPQKVRQAKQRYKHLKKKYKAISGDAGGSLIFDINLTSLISTDGPAIPPGTHPLIARNARAHPRMMHACTRVFPCPEYLHQAQVRWTQALG